MTAGFCIEAFYLRRNQHEFTADEGRAESLTG